MKVLILGVTGMLGNALWQYFNRDSSKEVWGTLRSGSALSFFPPKAHNRLISNIDVLNSDDLIKSFTLAQPDVVINCVGLIKQHDTINDPITVLPLNSIFPHRLAQLCKIANARLIHISTDCVFSGKKGSYIESDIPDAVDLYGKSKHLGEVSQLDNAITLRTSIIGHELSTSHSLIDWFLKQELKVGGYSKAIFSGLPTVELAKVINQYVIPDTGLKGLYHVATQAINKFELLNLVAKVYGKNIIIEDNLEVQIDRSLNADLFNKHTGYLPPNWTELIEQMYEFQTMMGVQYVSR